jgi:response regulator RpfG family c-di-GMP phosphodiesterase
MAGSENFSKISLEALSLKKGDKVPFDLFVFLHAAGRYHPIVRRGELLDGGHWANLQRLQGSNLYIKGEAYQELKSHAVSPTQRILADIKKPAFRGEILGDEAKKKLQGVYESLLLGTGASQGVAQDLTELSGSLLDVLVPEVVGAKAAILQQLRHIHLMNHAAAISALAVLTALANGFESKTAFSNLAFACLLMDAGLVDVTEKDLLTYYRNRSELPSHIMDKIRLHPMKSGQMLQGMKEVNETILQLVVLHHELHNGKGYHRGLRTGSVSPLARNLSFAVDLYENIKGAELRGEKVSLGQAILTLTEKGVDVHDRRHTAEISTRLCDYLKLRT